MTAAHAVKSLWDRTISFDFNEIFMKKKKINKNKYDSVHVDKLAGFAVLLPFFFSASLDLAVCFCHNRFELGTVHGFMLITLWLWSTCTDYIAKKCSNSAKSMRVQVWLSETCDAFFFYHRFGCKRLIWNYENDYNQIDNKIKLI